MVTLSAFLDLFKGYPMVTNKFSIQSVSEAEAVLLSWNRKCQDHVYMKWEYWSTMQKIKHNYRLENKVNENEVLYFKELRCETIKNNKKVVFLMSSLETYYVFKLDLNECVA